MRALMCPPDFIRIDKEINECMDKRNQPDRQRARVEWLRLVAAYAQWGIKLWFIEPEPQFQDMCFAANAGWCQWNKLILGNFIGKMGEARQGEIAYYRQWFEKRRGAFSDIEIHLIPHSRTALRYGFAGQGDVVTVGTSKKQATILMGYGQERTAYEMYAILREIHGLAPHQVKPIRLIDNKRKLYDLDLICFYIPPFDSLPETLIWYPPGTDKAGQSTISELVDKNNQIIIDVKKAHNAVCNSVFVPVSKSMNILTHYLDTRLFSQLRERGYIVRKCPTHEFLKSGGGIRCLTLFLPEKRCNNERTVPRADSEKIS